MRKRQYRKVHFMLKHGQVPDWKFDPKQLKIGTKIEKEHTNNKEIAKMIAKAHLLENPRYYTKLKKAGL